MALQTGAAARVIVVDDEADLREPVAAYLREEGGLHVEEASGGAELDRLLASAPADVVVLDVNMPGEDGFSIARRLRSAGAMGVIMLTAKSSVFDRIVGLELGADDYMAKPFEPRELLARVRALLRRSSAPPLAAAEPAGAYDAEFWVRTPEGQTRVHLDAVDWIEAAKDYVLLHTRHRSHILRHTMAALEKRLDPAKMLRVHRSAFVRPGAVARVERTGRITGVHIGDRLVPVGPQYAADVEERLGLKR